MSELFEKSIRTLELPAVLEMLSAKAVSEAAREKSRHIMPATERQEVLRLLDETDAAKERLGLYGSPSFSGVKDVSEPLARADRGGMLNTRELLNIAGLLTAARRVYEYDAERKGEATAIDRFFSALHTNKYLEDRIHGAILDEETIADTASAELTDIRRKMRIAASKGRQILQKIISSPSYAKVLQEALITQRDGRFVVPVKAECKGSLPGLVHDISSSGATLFVEPMGVVQANNELKELEAREEKEIERILRELSAQCADAMEYILLDYDMLVHLDMIFARAQLSYTMNASRPEVVRRGAISLKRARHPLLDQAKAVPVTVELGGDYDTLVITGPNTGGKTVTLKTLGLLCLMAQCGLHIPADSGSTVRVFDRILADVGDEQSIEQSLSTFSAHMSNTVEILRQADDDSLILFDELGAGTDPVEGAALAIAIIQHARSKGALIAATTHYAELKTFAMTTAGVENASCEFDVQTLRPTYRLLVGIPGKSNAFAISRRLGLDESVIADAKAQMDSESLRFEDVLAQLEEKRQRLEKAQTEANRLWQQREEDARKARIFREQMEKAKENARAKGEAEAKRIVREAQQKTEEIFAQLEELRKQQTRAANFQQVNDAKAAIRHDLKEAEAVLHSRDQEPEAPAPSRPIAVGDLVELAGVKTAATVLNVNGDGSMLLQAGRMKMTVKAGQVQLLESAEEIEKRKKQAAAAQRKNVSPQIQLAARAASELDIRGMETLEAESVVENYIDAAVMAKLGTVTIIHGKGTGALRKAVHEMLKRNRAVKSFRLGRYGEGEAGVTVVELK
jgi:DNA mismatch repair protein MutS2